MNPLPLNVHTAEQVRALDRHAVEALQIPSYVLMTRAGQAAFALVQACWPSARRIVIVCGPGNNGGDGYVLARIAREHGLDVDVMALAAPERLRADARRAWEDHLAAGGSVQAWDASRIEGADLIVDAIFGTGLSRPVDAGLAECIRAINASPAPTLALDIPSGLHADTGRVLGAAVAAERTLAFIGLKLGYYLGEGPNHAGIVTFDDLSVPTQVRAQVDAAARRIPEHLLAQLLPPRARMAHKGLHGHVLVLGGGQGMAGAARLAGEAALRSGAGRVTIATRTENVAAIVGGRPELMCRGVAGREEVDALTASADLLAIGPGLGQDAWAQTLFEAALASAKPAIVDADGLNLLARSPRARQAWVLTPHPAEAGRLLGKTASQVQDDRLGAAREIAARYGATVVLKGAATLVAEGGALASICDRGNPGMATAGMGDVLTGIIAGIAAQTRDRPGSLPDAARAGVLAHAMAGDLAARHGERGLLASDLYPYLPTCLNPAQHPRSPSA